MRAAIFGKDDYSTLETEFRRLSNFTKKAAGQMESKRGDDEESLIGELGRQESLVKFSKQDKQIMLPVEKSSSLISKQLSSIVEVQDANKIDRFHSELNTQLSNLRNRIAYLEVR